MLCDMVPRDKTQVIFEGNPPALNPATGTILLITFSLQGVGYGPCIKIFKLTCLFAATTQKILVLHKDLVRLCALTALG